MDLTLLRGRTCRECSVYKDAEHFYVKTHKSTGRQYLSAACKPCTAVRLRRSMDRRGPEVMRATWRKYAQANPHVKQRANGKRTHDQQRDLDLRRFGISLEVYDAILAAQGGVCAICERPERRMRKDGTLISLAVDHDHQTGRVRGLLCGACNTLLGMAEDDIDRLASAASYLRKGA